MGKVHCKHLTWGIIQWPIVVNSKNRRQAKLAFALQCIDCKMTTSLKHPHKNGMIKIRKK